MRQSMWFLAAFLVVSLSSCNRSQQADLILTFGFHPKWNRRVESAHRKQQPASTDIASDHSLQQLTAAMLELRRASRKGPARARKEAGEITGILARIRSSGEMLVGSKYLGSAERHQVRETELAALNLAADLVPEEFATARNSFQRVHFSQDSFAPDRAEASALRILSEYLTATVMPPSARYALTLHALTYPDCPLNVQLFSTMVERLTNERKLQCSIQVATDGTKLCAHQPGAKKLQDQLRRVCAEHPVQRLAK